MQYFPSCKLVIETAVVVCAELHYAAAVMRFGGAAAQPLFGYTSWIQLKQLQAIHARRNKS